jgi:SAM-dependent methyltransferase
MELKHSQEDPRELLPNYGSWVSTKLIYASASIALLLGALSLAWPGFLAPAVFFLFWAFYFAYARYQFSPSGRNLQGRIIELLVDRFDWDGEGAVLDIGCGNGALTVRLAQEYPQAQVIGVDYWGGAWEYSARTCDSNATIEGVADRVTFRRGSAVSLPFEDQFFDAAVSNLVFHEVRDAREKKELIREALRVVKNGGTFAFQDLFLFKQVYGDISELVDSIRSWGIERVEFVDTSRSEFIPKALKLPFMVGTVGILYGIK